MCNEKIIVKNHVGFITLLLVSLILIPVSLSGKSAYGESEGKPEEKSAFELTVKDGLISLNAKAASLDEIMEELGSSMKIEVLGDIPEEENISVKFDRLSLKDALEKLSSNHGFLMDSDYGDGKIAKIIILPKGKESRIQEIESTKPVKHESFKFEFNPMEHMETVE